MLLKEWRRNAHRTDGRNSHQINAPSPAIEALDRSEIAQLSAATIAEMTDDELVRVISAAELPRFLQPGPNRHLPYGDREALLRLAHLARRCCRNQGY